MNLRLGTSLSSDPLISSLSLTKGSRGRCLLLFLARGDDAMSMFLLSELPLDLVNLAFWVRVD